jgi:hypothetical protein
VPQQNSETLGNNNDWSGIQAHMRRREWQEIEDRAWCPGWVRDAMTGYLQAVIDQARPYDVAAPILRAVLEQTGARAIHDLASGGGGPWPDLASELGCQVQVTLSDIAPSLEAQLRLAGTSDVEYVPESISALEPPESRHGVWTMFTSLHHFSPSEVRDIMSTAQSRGVTLCAFEATSRSARGVVVTLAIPLLVLLLMPRVRPRRLLPLVLTYFPPILPILIWWDGLASTMRTYTAAERESLAAEVAIEGYDWNVRELKVPGAPIPVLSLVGGTTGVVA